MSINVASPEQVSRPNMAVSLAVRINAVYSGNKQDGDKMIWMTEGLISGLLFSTFLWHSTSLGLPQVVVDGQGVHADWHSLGRDDGELLSVGAVLVQLVDHLLADALGSGARHLLYLFGVGEVRVERPELAAAVTKQDHQVVGLALLQLLVGEEVKQK